MSARQWCEAEIAYQDDLATVDLRGLAAWRLDILRDEAGTAGDEDMVETIDRIRRVRSGAVEITEQGVHELVDDNEIARRRASWQPNPPRYTTGVLGKYAKLVQGAETGAITNTL